MKTIKRTIITAGFLGLVVTAGACVQAEDSVFDPNLPIGAVSWSGVAAATAQGPTASPSGPEINVKVTGTDTASGGTYFAGTASTSISFTIENTGDGALNLTGGNPIAVTGAQFSPVNPTPGATSIPGGGTTGFTVDYSQATGSVGTVTITSDDGDEGSYLINLTGECGVC